MSLLISINYSTWSKDWMVAKKTLMIFVSETKSMIKKWEEWRQNSSKNMKEEMKLRAIILNTAYRALVNQNQKMTINHSSVKSWIKVYSESQRKNIINGLQYLIWMGVKLVKVRKKGLLGIGVQAIILLILCHYRVSKKRISSFLIVKLLMTIKHNKLP